MPETSNSKTGILTLAKIMIAVAWADGEISEDEKLCIKDMLFHLPSAGLDAGIQLTAQEWTALEMYLESPADEAELLQLVEQLKSVITDKNDRQIVLDYLHQIVSVDGDLSANESAMLAEIENELSSSSSTGFMGSLRKLFSGSVERRSTAVSQSATRDQYFTDFVKNKVYYELQRSGKSIDVTDKELRRMGLAGGLMARIVYVDQSVTKGETDTMARLIQNFWGTDEDTAVFIANIAVSSVDTTYDYFRMTREFYEETTPEERIAFLDVLFNIAASDGQATFNEIEEIRLVSRGLNLPNETFINAKLKIPREQRAA